MEHITMDFMGSLPETLKRPGTIWILMDRLTKSSLFIPMSLNYAMDKLSKLNRQVIVWLHRVPVSIISDGDSRFTSGF